MRRVSATYGWRDSTVVEVAQMIRDGLGLELEPRTSLYRGDYYSWDGPAGAELVLQENLVDEEGEPAEPDHAGHPAILYASLVEASLADGIEDLRGVDPLRRTERDLV